MTLLSFWCFFFFFFFFVCFLLFFFQMIRDTLVAIVQNVGVAVVLMSEVVNRRPRNDYLNKFYFSMLVPYLMPYDIRTIRLTKRRNIEFFGFYRS